MEWARVCELAPKASGRITQIMSQAGWELNDFGEFAALADSGRDVDGQFTPIDKAEVVVDWLDESGEQEKAPLAELLYDAYRELQAEFEKATTVGSSSLHVHVRFHDAESEGDSAFDDVNGAYCLISGHTQWSPAGTKFKDDLEEFGFVQFA